MAHQPGPWTLRRGPTGLGVDIRAADGSDVQLYAPKNMPLVAAAPELLAAAKEALDLVTNAPGNWPDGVREMLGRAITKAEEPSGHGKPSHESQTDAT
jgi:hypothetical protein